MPPLTARLLQRIREVAATGQPAFGAAGGRIAVDPYVSQERFRAERATLFRRWPLIVAHSSEIAPGAVLPHDGYGLPLLLARDAGGVLRCFINVCRHRGMRLADEARACNVLVCPYHGWTYRLDGSLRHLPHAEAFDEGVPSLNLQALPCAERAGLAWIVPEPGATLDLDAHLGALNEELPWFGLDGLVLYRKVEAEYAANWKLIVDAFLESYHIRVLHRETIYPFFADGVVATERVGPHIHSLVARRKALEPFDDPASHQELRRLATPSQLLFPNTITIFHPDYLSLISLFPLAPDRLRWTHRMLVPRDKTTPDWTPHWEKTFDLVERGVFQKEDIHAAVQIQRGFASGANRWLEAGRLEEGLAWFHAGVEQAVAAR